ncbi:MAG: replication-associated recombination protein A [Candidatus Moranbacteria bacterium]|nr:replication-associated recombination protein A [Candidatus Moranbacteria bacterium]
MTEHINHIPLAERMRPKTVDEFFGQEKIFGEGSFLREAVRQGSVPSLLFWGPPGSGKTTLARLLAGELSAQFVQFSAVSSGKKDLQVVLEQAKENRAAEKQTILFLDEIHRWNKAQQDALLPYVENGTIILIGATTENPSFSVNSALLSRTRVLVLEKLAPGVIKRVLNRALKEDTFFVKQKVTVEEGGLAFLAEASGGDARQALSALEACAMRAKKISVALIEEVMARSHLLYDKGGEWHYDVISALHKSMRGGDADASLYYLGRMLEAGEDPLYVARRLIRFASEDVGLANSFALPQAVAAMEACKHIGMPECEMNLAQAVVYLALSKKSSALYMGYGAVKADIAQFPNEPVPLHLRNAPTKLMKSLDYGKGYKYTPDFKDTKEAAQEYLPERLRGRKYLDILDKDKPSVSNDLS